MKLSTPRCLKITEKVYLQSNSVTRQVTFNRTKIGGKGQNSKLKCDKVQHISLQINCVTDTKVNNDKRKEVNRNDNSRNSLNPKGNRSTCHFEG